MSTTWTMVASVALLSANGFFVAAEFALIAAKRHRLEQFAATGSRAARSALAGSRQLSLMLAGAQLGITLCTLGLGALAKPAVAHLLEPAFAAVGLPVGLASGLAIIIAVAVVAFLHVVVGEMAPKSWAISHPESSAMLLARPFMWFTTTVRPVLSGLNALANVCLRLAKVTPQEELAQAHGPQELRILIEASREHGMLAAPEHQLLAAMLNISTTTVEQIMIPTEKIVTIDADATARHVEQTSRAAGRSRLLVTDPTSGAMIGIVHIRDAARAISRCFPTIDSFPDVGHLPTARDLMDQPTTIAASTPVATAVRQMRQTHTQLALVTNDTGSPIGLIAMEDLLEELIGEFDDETDPIPAAARQAGRTC